MIRCKKSIVVMLLVITALDINLISQSYAGQKPADGLEVGSSKVHYDVEVEPFDVARLRIQTSAENTWDVGIHPSSDRGRLKNDVHAFVRPLFFLRTRTRLTRGANAEIPKIIHSLRYEDDGLMHMGLRVILSSPELRVLCQKELFARRPDLMKAWGVSSYRELKIQAWPMLHLVIRCFAGGPTGKFTCRWPDWFHSSSRGSD